MNDGTDDETEEQTESLGAKVTPSFKQRVRVVAAHQGMNMSEYVRRAVQDAVEEDEQSGDFRISALSSD